MMKDALDRSGAMADCTTSRKPGLLTMSPRTIRPFALLGF